MIREMLALISVYHKDQKDKGGIPYIQHLMTVACSLKTNDDELFCIALGHDLLEDTLVGTTGLKAMGMTRRVIKGIYDLTRLKNQLYEDYKLQVCSNIDAINVKLADIMHNMDLGRLNRSPTTEDFKRLEKYGQFQKELYAAKWKIEGAQK